MELQELIYKRKSTRAYTGILSSEKTLEDIRSFIRSARPLYPEIRTRFEIMSGESVKTILPWRAPHNIAIFAEDKPGAAVNAGFIFQQTELYIQSLGLGSCWVGMGKPDQGVESGPDGLPFVILLSFGEPKGSPWRERGEFKRKTLDEISDKPDERLEPARLAPSSVNRQPWYFHHDGEDLHVYCVTHGLTRKKPTRMILVDVGIALGQLYVANPETFRFFTAKKPPVIRGYEYIGTVTL